MISFASSYKVIGQVRYQGIVAATPTFTLPSLLPFIPSGRVGQVDGLACTPIVRISIKLHGACRGRFRTFNKLIPSYRRGPILNVLFPSTYFSGHSPRKNTLCSCFLNKAERPRLLRGDSSRVVELVAANLGRVLSCPTKVMPSLVHVFQRGGTVPRCRDDDASEFTTVGRLRGRCPKLIMTKGLGKKVNVTSHVGRTIRVTQRE